RTKFPVITDRPYFLTLGGHALFWFSLEPMKAEIISQIGVSPPAVVRPSTARLDVPGEWELVLRGKAREGLQEILPAYMKGRHWFQGRDRQTEAAMIVETVPMPYASGMAQLALVQV